MSNKKNHPITNKTNRVESDPNSNSNSNQTNKHISEHIGNGIDTNKTEATETTSSHVHISNVRRYWSPVWIVPIICMLIGVWLVYQHYSSLGPQVVLTTTTADGIEAGKTRIKTRSVDIGVVETVRLSDDLSKVVISARLTDGMDDLLTTDTAFWVVRPQIDKSGISGLGTLLSGPYIELLPGLSNERQKQFTLLDTPPIAAPDAKGLRVFLDSERYGQLSAGDPVLYRGFQVGTVETSNFDPETRKIKYQLFIKSPFDRLITENVRFWKDSGIAVDLSAQGVRVEMGSLTTLFSGGVSFELPDGWSAGNKVMNNSRFRLYDNKTSIQEQEFTDFKPYVLLVSESIRGLEAGAPVEFRGIRLGTVVQSPMVAENPELLTNNNYLIPIMIHIEPARFTKILGEQFNIVEQFEKGELRGLRASLKTANLLTGALFVDLDFYPEEQLWAGNKEFAGFPVLPTISGGIAQIQQKVMAALDKINHLPIEPLLNETTQTIATSRDTLNALKNNLDNLNRILSQQSVQELPEVLNNTLLELNLTLEGLQPGSEGYDSAIKTLQRLEQVLRETQPLMQTLNQKSNALIFQAPKGKDPEPKAFNSNK